MMHDDVLALFQDVKATCTGKHDVGAGVQLHVAQEMRAMHEAQILHDII
jgi:hypothetical protein